MCHQINNWHNVLDIHNSKRNVLDSENNSEHSVDDYVLTH